MIEIVIQLYEQDRKYWLRIWKRDTDTGYVKEAENISRGREITEEQGIRLKLKYQYQWETHRKYNGGLIEMITVQRDDGKSIQELYEEISSHVIINDSYYSQLFKCLLLSIFNFLLIFFIYYFNLYK